MENEKVLSNDLDITSPYENSEKFNGYLKELTELRKDGESRIIALKDEIRDVRLNKQIDKETKKSIIEENKRLIEEAKITKGQNKDQISEIVKIASSEAKAIGKDYYRVVAENCKKRTIEIKAEFDETINNEKSAHEQRLQEIGIIDAKNATKEEVNAHKLRIHGEKQVYKTRIEEARNKREAELTAVKETKYNAYLEKYGYLGKVRNGHHAIDEMLEYKYRSYMFNFKLKDFLLRNALYFIILIFFIVCVFISLANNNNLLTWSNIRSILGQSSTKLFFSLGVAGLILIGGTDLSIGRMTGLAASVACLVLGKGVYSTNGGLELNFLDMDMGVRIIIAVASCILLCVLFSAVAGFFTAKFKMHPFVTTLATQLLIFGLMMVLFSNTPAFNMNNDVKKAICGDYNINLIIFAVIATAIVWFIWNKTKFGKYMYAVGGNSEAASVSGINVFAVTMGIFVMAGVLYGLGGFLEGARVASGTPNTGAGTELDAIAACVVGGISFSGGVGKIRGAVIGTIIFTGLTYCLTYVGLDTNVQYIFKGIIIMAAVCLDSLKFLKKK